METSASCYCIPNVIMFIHPWRQAIRRFQQLYYRPPIDMQRAGPDALIFRPRRIEGARHIVIGARSRINSNGWLSVVESYGTQTFTPHLTIGDDVQIGRYVCITCAFRIDIEDGCLFSEHVYVSDHAHGVDPAKGAPARQDLVGKGPVRVGACSFIGYRACLLPGVQLGRHCVVGANAVVTHSFPDYSMVAGSPARLIKVFSLSERAWKPVAT